MKVGVVLDGRRSAADIAELARLAEASGLAHVWVGAGARTKDHFVRLAVAAAATQRIQLGPVAVSPFEMHPAQLGHPPSSSATHACSSRSHSSGSWSTTWATASRWKA